MKAVRVRLRQWFCWLPVLSKPLQAALPFFARYLLIACALAAAIYSFVLARASWLFRQDTAISVPAAVELVPFDSTYITRLAAWRPTETITLLQQAVQLNPFDSESWIQLGFASEFKQHDRASAERYYLKAAEVNKMFLPKWTLTNFYFRQDQPAEFFHWASETLAITPYTPEPVFVQMWLIDQDADKIARNIPDRPRILLPYAWFLSNSHQYSSIALIVQRLIKAAGTTDPQAWGRDGLIATIEDRLIAQDQGDPALQIWASMVKGGWLHEDIPSAQHPLTNGNFPAPLFRHGFDWIPTETDGVRIEESPAEGLIRLQFSGNEPEHCVVLQQYMPMEAGRPYGFRWQSTSAPGDTLSGLTWHLKPVGKAAELDLASSDLGLPRSGNWKVRAPQGSKLYLLTLEYARPLGHLRARGTFILKSVSVSRE